MNSIRQITGIVCYEDLLNRDPRWALSEGSRHFEENSAVFKALHNIAQRLKALDIPYAVVGGMALFRYGLRRLLSKQSAANRFAKNSSSRGCRAVPSANVACPIA